ncbi:hypothetical protein K0504_06305 [Neiella marina]|uniref:Uncharacterized protein n=1 Tax=Neiella holothuriorum TaxID=2870530 RepID=A0ABS7EE96_9GAMM|nr:hypothetical protein [Neiella holothuriorum]MBW8190645.1 hypothetical protein [Neiella holothuriorum]
MINELKLSDFRSKYKIHPDTAKLLHSLPVGLASPIPPILRKQRLFNVADGTIVSGSLSLLEQDIHPNDSCLVAHCASRVDDSLLLQMVWRSLLAESINTAHQDRVIAYLLNKPKSWRVERALTIKAEPLALKHISSWQQIPISTLRARYKGVGNEAP